MPERVIEALLNKVKLLRLRALLLRDCRKVDFKAAINSEHAEFYVEDHPWCDRTRWRTILSMPIPSPKHALDPALVALGLAIRAIRESRGLSQEELAHRSHVDRSYMSGIERGTQNPGIMVVMRIATAAGVSLEELAAQAGI